MFVNDPTVSPFWLKSKDKKRIYWIGKNAEEIMPENAKKSHFSGKMPALNAMPQLFKNAKKWSKWH